MKKATIGAGVFVGLSLIFLIFAAVMNAAAVKDEKTAVNAWLRSDGLLARYAAAKATLDIYGGAVTDDMDLMAVMNTLNNSAGIKRDHRSMSREGSGSLKVTYKPITLPEFGLIMDGIKQNYPSLLVRDVRISATKEWPNGYEISMSISQRK